MLTAYRQFRRHLQQLNHHLLLLDAVEESIAEGASAKLSLFASRAAERRRYEHNAFVISLFVSFEKMLEEALAAYLRQLSAAWRTYADAPAEFQNAHIDLSFQFLRKIEEGRIQNAPTAADIISNLHSCVVEQKPGQINIEAFSIRGANFRSAVIDEYFSRAGVKVICQRVRKSNALGRVYRSLTQKYLMPTSLPGNELGILNDFVQVRNQVAHGSPTDLFSRNAQKKLLIYFNVLARSLAGLLESDLMLEIVEKKGVASFRPYHVYRKRIACVRNVNVPLHVGMLLAMKYSQGGCTNARIVEIQNRNSSVDFVSGVGEEGISLKLDKSVTTGCDLFVLEHWHTDENSEPEAAVQKGASTQQPSSAQDSDVITEDAYEDESFENDLGEGYSEI